MTIQLRKAERKQAKIRVGMFGPSGSGKTMSALKMARGMAPWEKICVIDTENGSADLYSHLGDFNVITISPPYDPEKYTQAMKIASDAGMLVIILDSISHEWDGTGGMLEIAYSMAIQLKDGRLAWNKVTPRHNKFIDSIKFSPAHIICCGRSKQEKVINKREKGGITAHDAERIGLKAVTREGFEYEMTVVFDLSINHYATCSKDRTTDPKDGNALFQDRPPMIIGEEVGVKLKTWSESGVVDFQRIKTEIMAELNKAVPENFDAWTKESADTFVEFATGLKLIEENYSEILPKLIIHNSTKLPVELGPVDSNEIFPDKPAPELEPALMPEPAPKQAEKAPVAPVEEQDNLVPASETKLNVLRKIAKTKMMFDDKNLLEFIRFYCEIDVQTMDQLTEKQSTKVFDSLTKFKTQE